MAPRILFLIICCLLCSWGLAAASDEGENRGGFLANESPVVDNGKPILLARMDKPPVMETPTGGGTGLGCDMTPYRGYYDSLRGNTPVIPSVPLSASCNSCLQRQSEWGNGWANASRNCRPNCCQ